MFKRSLLRPFEFSSAADDFWRFPLSYLLAALHRQGLVQATLPSALGGEAFCLYNMSLQSQQETLSEVAHNETAQRTFRKLKIFMYLQLCTDLFLS